MALEERDREKPLKPKIRDEGTTVQGRVTACESMRHRAREATETRSIEQKERYRSSKMEDMSAEEEESEEVEEGEAERVE